MECVVCLGYASARGQLLCIWRAVYRARKVAGLELVSRSSVPTGRIIYQPFDEYGGGEEHFPDVRQVWQSEEMKAISHTLNHHRVPHPVRRCRMTAMSLFILFQPSCLLGCSSHEHPPVPREPSPGNSTEAREGEDGLRHDPRKPWDNSRHSAPTGRSVHVEFSGGGPESGLVQVHVAVRPSKAVAAVTTAALPVDGPGSTIRGYEVRGEADPSPGAFADAGGDDGHRLGVHALHQSDGS